MQNNTNARENKKKIQKRFVLKMKHNEKLHKTNALQP